MALRQFECTRQETFKGYTFTTGFRIDAVDEQDARYKLFQKGFLPGSYELKEFLDNIPEAQPIERKSGQLSLFG